MPTARPAFGHALSAALCLLALHPAPAAAATTSTIYIGGARTGDTTPYTVDPFTGAASLFGSAVGPMEGMSYDSTRDRIVATLRGTNSQIKTIDPITGAVGNLPIPKSADIRGLAYDLNRDLFWASDQATGNLFTMNPVTGALTLAQPIPLPGSIRPGGLGYDPLNDLLYAIDDNRLFSINVAAGAPYIPTAIGPVGLGVGFTDVDAMEFDPVTNKLFIIDDRDGGGVPLNTIQRFAELDPATGLATIIGQTGLMPQLGQGMAIVPEPFAVAPALLAAAALRRRQPKPR